VKAIRLWAKPHINSMFPRRLYFMESLEEIAKAFPTCFVFSGVSWWKYGELKEFMKDQGIKQKSFMHLVVPLHLVPIPTTDIFIPSKGVFDRFSSTLRGWANGEPKLLVDLIYDRLDTISMFVNSRHYKTPCEVCHDYMNHVYGKCSLVDKASKKHCHSSLVFEAHDVLKIEDEEVA